MRLELIGGSIVERLFAWDVRSQRGCALVRMNVRKELEAIEVDLESLRVVDPAGVSSFPESVARACCLLAQVVIGSDGQRVKPESTIREHWAATA